MAHFRGRSARTGIVALVLATGVVARSARAETDEQRAVTLFEKGRKLAREGRCAEAIAPLLESIRYAEGVGPLLNLGNCYETLGKTASAHRYFVRAQEVAATHDDRRRDEAAQRARSIEKDVPVLVIHIPASIKSPTTNVHVDGEPWPLDRWDAPTPIDPGSHEIEVVAPPHPKQTVTLTVRGNGDRVEWTAPVPTTPTTALSPAPTTSTNDEWHESSGEPPSSTQRTLGLVTGGVGVGGLLAGAIFGVISISAHSSIVGRCPSYPRCPTSDRLALDDMNTTAQTTGTIATIAVVAGALLLAGGATLFFTAPAPQPEVRPRAGRAR